MVYGLGKLSLDVTSDELKRAVEATHGGEASLAKSVPVKEVHGNMIVWEGIVHVFDLAGWAPEGGAGLCVVIPGRRIGQAPVLRGAAHPSD